MDTNAGLSRRQFLKASAAGALALTTGTTHAASASRPNFVIIMADDLGYGDLGCYGNDAIATPSIDALAKGGLRFTDFHSNGPVCSPTRAALMTGRYQQRSGIDSVVSAKNHRDTGMGLGEITFAEVLRDAGYRTALFGKWHLGYKPEFNPVRQGFDEFSGFVSGNVDYHSHIDQVGIDDWWQGDRLKDETGYSTDLITRHGLRFIEENATRPFCLTLAHECPHYPYQGPNDKPDRRTGHPDPIHGSRTDKRAAYKEMLEAMDAGVGAVVERLRALGIEESTLVFFCSDNGSTPPGSTGGLRGKKGTLYEGGHRVPGIAYWPGTVKPGGTTDQLAMTMDLFPTMAALAGAQLPSALSLDGVDLSRSLFQGTAFSERTVFWAFKGKRAMRRGAWKLIEDELYNLENDPGEARNLASEQPERYASMNAACETWRREVTMIKEIV